MKLRLLALAISIGGISALIAGCSGGGSSSSGSGSGTGLTGSSQVVQGTVAAPGGSLTDAVAIKSVVSTSDETGVSGLTVTVGTISAGSTDSTFTFTPISGATATTASDGSFSITVSSSVTLTADTVVVASQGAAPTTLPATGVFVTPVVGGKLLIDPASTVATEAFYQQFNGDPIAISKADLTLLKSFLLSVENAASSTSGSSTSDLETKIKLQISADPGVSTTLSGVVVSEQETQNPTLPKGTLSSGAAFVTGLDSSSDAYNGDSAEFTANDVRICPDLVPISSGGVQIVGMQNPTASTPGRTVRIAIPSVTGPLSAGTYSATITYSEQTATSTGTTPAAKGEDTSTDNDPPPPPLGNSSSGSGFGPGGGFYNDISVSLWQATSVQIVVTQDATSSTTLDLAIASATYSPITDDRGAGNSEGTFTTGLTGTVPTH